MIRVTIEMIPKGVEEARFLIETFDIANIGESKKPMYEVKRGGEFCDYRIQGTNLIITNHDRGDGVRKLVERALDLKDFHEKRMQDEKNHPTRWVDPTARSSEE